MALPKGKVSKMRGRLRRTHYKLTAPTLTACPQCHRVCKNCGTYNGRQVLVINDDKKKA
jgi:large subunit ribosomal protein L32